MRASETAPRRDHAAWLLGVGLILLAASAAAGERAQAVPVLVALACALVAWHRVLLDWVVVVGALALTVLFLPIGRYELPVSLPFGVEPYELVVAAAVLGWAGSLLVDERVRLRRTPLDGPVALVAVAALASAAVNLDRVAATQDSVVKALGTLAAAIVAYALITSVLTSFEAVERLARVLTAAAAAVAALAVVESRSGLNVFDHLHDAFPFLVFHGPVEVTRAGLVRAVASAEHPIPLGVLLAVVLPLAVALAVTRSRAWWAAAALLLVGSLATVSRTAVVVLAVVVLVLVVLRPVQMGRVASGLAVLAVVAALSVPGALGAVRDAFFPAGGLVAEQSRLAPEADPLLAGGRIRQIGPMLEEAARTPLLGQGLGTRITGFDNPERNAPILDNQWLSILLEVGIAGLAAWILLFTRAVRRLRTLARADDGPAGWLAAALAASVAGYAVGMATYDAFAFGQVTLVFWVLLALAAVLLRAGPAATPSR